MLSMSVEKDSESELNSSFLRMEAMSPGYTSEAEDRNHRDVAEHLSKVEKENFNLKLRIYHMEEHINSKGGQDFQSIVQQKVELEECRHELDTNQKLLLAANKGINSLKKEVEDEQRLRSKAEDELDSLRQHLKKVNEEKDRSKKQIDRLRDEARRTREKSTLNNESTENRLNDSLKENDDLQSHVEDLQNNNVSLEEELGAKEDEIARVQDENDDLIDEIERLKDENMRLAGQASRACRKPRSYEIGIQCESRMCEKACQTRTPNYAPRSRLPRPSERSMHRTNSVGNLSDRTNSPSRSYGSSRDLTSRIPATSRFQESPQRYQSLVHGQNKELTSLRRQLNQARSSTARLRSTIDELLRADYVEQRRLITQARRLLRKLEGDLEDRNESATSDCQSESDYDPDPQVRSTIMPVLSEIKQMIAGLRQSPKLHVDQRQISRSIRDAFDTIDSGLPTSPTDLNEAHLIPGLVQDLQQLRMKLDKTVQCSEDMREKRERPLSIDSGCQTDVSGTTIALYNDELSALRDALKQKDGEIDKLRAEAITREMRPFYVSTPVDRGSKRKSFFSDDNGPLTPPESSGAENSFSPKASDLRSLREGLNQGRLLSKSIYHKTELGVEDTDEMIEEVHDLVTLLDEMSRMLQRMQYKACHQETDNAENIRLRNKVQSLEKMLATTVSRMQRNSLMKQGIDHSITSKLSHTAGLLGRARLNLGNSTPSTSRATSLNGDSF